MALAFWGNPSCLYLSPMPKDHPFILGEHSGPLVLARVTVSGAAATATQAGARGTPRAQESSFTGFSTIHLKILFESRVPWWPRAYGSGVVLPVARIPAVARVWSRPGNICMPQVQPKKKNRTTIWSRNPASAYLSEESEITILKRYLLPRVCTAARFTGARTRNSRSAVDS